MTSKEEYKLRGIREQILSYVDDLCNEYVRIIEERDEAIEDLSDRFDNLKEDYDMLKEDGDILIR